MRTAQLLRVVAGLTVVLAAIAAPDVASAETCCMQLIWPDGEAILGYGPTEEAAVADGMSRADRLGVLGEPKSAIDCDVAYG